jgi:hypothetical protein
LSETAPLLYTIQFTSARTLSDLLTTTILPE